MAVGQPRPEPDHAAALLHADGRGARPRGRGHVRRHPAVRLARRRPHGRERGLRTARLGPPRHLGRPARSRPADRRSRRRRQRHERPRELLVPAAVADRADVPRLDRRPPALLRLRQPPGRTLDARAEPRPLRRTHPGHPGRRVALRRRLRGRFLDGPPRRPGPGVDRLLRRSARALRPALGAVPRCQRLAAGHRELPGLGTRVPLPVDGALRHLAARSGGRLRRQPVRPPEPRPRPELGADLARSHHRRPGAHAPHRRPDPRRRRTDDRAGRVRDRREPARARADLGRHERRPDSS